ncbi:MAG: cytochrome C oxidase subunit IV family protein [Nitrospinota bacterium]
MSAERAHPKYVTVWIWLMVLAIVSVVVSVLPFPRLFINAFVFVVAGVKAALVALNFMHLKFERVLIWLLVLIPLSFFVILTAVLVHDIIPQ